MVGDVKQSIYSFRQAMPDIFIRYKDKFPRYDREKDAYPGIYRVRPQLPFAQNRDGKRQLRFYAAYVPHMRRHRLRRR